MLKFLTLSFKNRNKDTTSKPQTFLKMEKEETQSSIDWKHSQKKKKKVGGGENHTQKHPRTNGQY